MLKAIHKESGMIISAWKLQTDATWIGKERTEFIAPRPDIFNFGFLEKQGITEVKVSFVKAHERNYDGEITHVIPHFRIETEGAIENPINQSEEHILAKNGIYEDLLNNELYIDGENISKFHIDFVDIERKVSYSGKYVIADVITRFKKESEIYGKGFIFEIQFSNQERDIKEERNYDRALCGYSVIWLCQNDFINNKLKEKKLSVMPYTKVIEQYSQLKQDEYIKQINNFGDIIDKKARDTKQFLDEQNQLMKSLTIDMKKEMFNSMQYSKELFQKFIDTKSNLFFKTINETTEEKVKAFIEDITNSTGLPEKVSENLLSKIEYAKMIENISNIILRDDKINKLLKEIIITKANEDIENKKNQLLQELENNVKEKITKLDEKLNLELFGKLISNIEKKYEGYGGTIFCKCQNCNNQFPVRSMEFNKGYAYCLNCFKDMEGTWKKEIVSKKIEVLKYGNEDKTD